MTLTAARTWNRREVPGDIVAELEHEGRFSPLAARILALRGVHDAATAEAFLAKRLADLHRPELMRDMEVAATRFAQAISNRGRIMIHGDYDVDGSTSSALLAWFVRICSHEATVWIPHRRIDGYGLSEASLQAVKDQSAQLMITVDCGIADNGWAARIEAETGCTVIITDHHLPQQDEPRCTAVCNPNRRGCPYPEKGLAGVGVAWKLAWATAVKLSGSQKLPGPLRDFLLDALALVAVGTIADCATLTGENRILVHHGLSALVRTRNPGLRALLEHTKLDTDISASDIGWKIGPLLNAAGRVGSAMENIRLLTAQDAATAQAELDAIVVENEERKRLTQILSQDLIAEVEKDPRWKTRATLVFAGEGWHQGVVGIVASRLVEQFGKPAAVIAIADGKGKGSLRSIAKVNLGEALDACRHHLIRGGGHAMAAGLTIEPDRISAFSETFENHVAQMAPAGTLTPRTEFDGEATLRELDAEFFANLERMGPFGNGNPEPILRVSQATFVSRPKTFGQQADHLRCAITDAGGGMREMLAWRGGKHLADFSVVGRRFDLLVKPQPSRWRGELQQRLVYVDGRSI